MYIHIPHVSTCTQHMITAHEHPYNPRTTYMHTYICTHTCIYAYTHTCIHIYAHAYYGATDWGMSVTCMRKPL